MEASGFALLGVGLGIASNILGDEAATAAAAAVATAETLIGTLAGGFTAVLLGAASMWLGQLAKSAGLVAAQAGLVAAAFTFEAGEPSSWWTENDIASFSNVMVGLTMANSTVDNALSALGALQHITIPGLAEPIPGIGFVLGGAGATLIDVGFEVEAFDNSGAQAAAL